ncbi:hypothetical protein [Lentilactobacillus kisonensis]|uniref:hypothetical protein n=1 Tax=Lentilactobacillus kisonensis TaxID=481722 RepID=UPI0006D2A633|nr:hypothetical protein [Lentilactobacillus kisonensis]
MTVKFTTENGQAIKGNYIIQNEQLYQPLDLSNDSEIVIPGYELTSISKRRLKTTIHKSDHQVILKYTPVAVEQPTPQETKTSNEVGNPNKENSAAGSQQTVVKSTEATGTQSANHSNNNQSPDLKLGKLIKLLTSMRRQEIITLKMNLMARIFQQRPAQLIKQ